MEQKQQVWFVTGASKGLGLTLVKKLLSQGHLVAATSRNEQELRRVVNNSSEQFLALSMNLTDEKNVETAIGATIARFGRIDVVVNNAGYGLAGALEELSDAESRGNFDTNVFGMLNVIRHVMPQLRRQGSGHILNISSIAGFIGNFPGFGIYCATKFAVDGLSESLSAEAKPFGINVTIVSPGYFRTEFLTAGSLAVPQQPLNEYTAVREVLLAHQTGINGNQPGDPEKAVDVMIEVAASKNPPLHLFLGTDAYDLAYAKMKAIEADLEAWKTQTRSTNYAQMAQH